MRGTWIVLDFYGGVQSNGMGTNVGRLRKYVDFGWIGNAIFKDGPWAMGRESSNGMATSDVRTGRRNWNRRRGRYRQTLEIGTGAITINHGTMLCRMGLGIHTRWISTRFQALTHAVFVMRASSNASDIEAMRRISIRLFAGRRTLRQVRAETFRFGAWLVRWRTRRARIGFQNCKDTLRTN